MDIIFDSEKGDFGLELYLGPQMEKPADVFQSMGNLIQAIDDIDRELAKSIDIAFDPYLVLLALEAGSLKTWFASHLRAIPDEVLKDGEWKKILGYFLVKAKYKILKWLKGKDTLGSAEDLYALNNEINSLKNEVEQFRHLPTKSPVPLPVILTAVNKVSIALAPLPPGHSIFFASEVGSLEINRSFSISNEKIQEVLASKFKTEKTQMLLRVKKPDYLGTSKWEVMIRGHAESVKIIDQEWLERFHHRKINLLPGDALLASVRIDVYFDEDGNEFQTKYTIEKVKEVVKEEKGQLDWFEENES